MDDNVNGIPRGYAPKSYALSGKIMLSAIIILFTVVVVIVCLHIYARWFLIRAHRRRIRRSRRRTHLVFYSDANNAAFPVPSQGLSATVLKTLPVFTYSSKTHKEALECAVCLSEFEENEKGRLLPKCNHRFHIECIDMWFHSHSTCPICRAPVTVNPEIPPPVTRASVEIVMSDSEPVGAEGVTGSSSGNDGDETGCSSSSSSASSSAGSPCLEYRRNQLELVGVSVEVPRRSEGNRWGVEEEILGLGSPRGPGLTSLGSRILSLKRILSRERRAGAVSPSSANVLSCSSAIELDLERGKEEAEQARTPR